MFNVDPNEMLIELTRGDTAQITFSAVDAEENPYVPSAGDKLGLTVAKKPGSDPIFSIVNTMDDDAEAFWNITILPEHTKDMKFGDYAFDVQLIHDSNVDTIIGITDDITPTFRVWGEVTLEETP